MDNFFTNWRNAMTRAIGNNSGVRHLSDIPEQQRQEYRNQYINQARQNDKNNPGSNTSGLNFYNAKENGNYWTTTGGDFNSDWNGPNYETRIYGFEYRKPDDSGHRGQRTATGRVLVRVPKNKTPGLFGGRVFNDGADRYSGDMGVYGAYLEDGTALSAEDFEDLVRTNPYGGFRWTGRFDGTGEYNNNSDKEKVSSFNKRQKEAEQNTGLARRGEYRWSHNARGWRQF